MSAVGDTFVSWYDPTRECQTVWDGRGYLLVHDGAASMPSSLQVAQGQQPAKPQGSRGSVTRRSCSLVAQSLR